MDFHNSFQLEGRGYRAEARTEAHPPNRKWDRSGEGEAKDQAEVRVQDGLAHPALAWGKVMMPFFLIFLLVCAVEDGIKVALFFHRVSLQHLTVVLVNFSLQVLVICLKTSWSPSFEPSCPNGPKRVANFEVLVSVYAMMTVHRIIRCWIPSRFGRLWWCITIGTNLCPFCQKCTGNT